MSAPAELAARAAPQDEADEHPPVVDGRFWQGLATGIPLGIMLWTAILWWVW